MFLCNAFSLQMLTDFNCQIKVQEVRMLPDGLESAVGHADTATVLGVKCNRVNVKLGIGETLFVAQLIGGRLPEGSTTLPEGFKFKFLQIDVLPPVKEEVVIL